jgi:hypothetical protein
MGPRDLTAEGLADAEQRLADGTRSARLHSRFVMPLIHFILYPRTYSVPLFLKRHCDRTLGMRPRNGMWLHAKPRRPVTPARL